jgi:hypothetical protein
MAPPSLRALLLVVAVLAALPVRAAVFADGPPRAWLAEKTLSALTDHMTWAQLRDAMRASFYFTDVDRTGITPETIDRHRQLLRAQRRASEVSRVLAFDLDGDGELTHDELMSALRKDAAAALRRLPESAGDTERDRLVNEWLARQVAQIMQGDADHDGRLTIIEIIAAADRRAAEAERRTGKPDLATEELVPPGLAAGESKVLTLDKFDAVVRSLFDDIDADRNGRVSPGEGEAFARRSGNVPHAARLAETARREDDERQIKREACNLSALPISGRLVLVGASRLQGLSDTALGDDNEVIGIARLIIEAGSEKLHLVLTGPSGIWLISGAVDRVASVVAVDGRAQGVPRVGVVGLPPDKVQFAAAAGCIPTFGTDETRDRDSHFQAADAVHGLMGRKPDLVIGEDELGTAHVPSGRVDENQPLPSVIQPPLLGHGRMLWQEFLEEWPGGVVHVDAGKVVSPLDARPYAVLPEKAGIAELMDERAIEGLGAVERVRLPTSPFDLSAVPSATITPEKFRIKLKIRIPAGFSGNFLLGRGVQMPEGDLRSSCVVSEEDGRKWGGRC